MSFAGHALNDSSATLPAFSADTLPLDLAHLGSVAGILLLCGPSISPPDRLLLRFVQTFFGPASLCKLTVIFNLWDQCRDAEYSTLRASLQGSATDPDVAAVRNPPHQHQQQGGSAVSNGPTSGGKILTCAPRQKGEERVTNLTPIVRRRYDGDRGEKSPPYVKFQFVREIEDGKSVEQTEAARTMALGIDGDGGVKIVDGFARTTIGAKKSRVAGARRMSSGVGRLRRRESSQESDSGRDAAAAAAGGYGQADDAGPLSPDEFAPPMSPTLDGPIMQSMFPGLTVQAAASDMPGVSSGHATTTSGLTVEGLKTAEMDGSPKASGATTQGLMVAALAMDGPALQSDSDAASATLVDHEHGAGVDHNQQDCEDHTQANEPLIQHRHQPSDTRVLVDEETPLIPSASSSSSSLVTQRKLSLRIILQQPFRALGRAMAQVGAGIAAALRWLGQMLLAIVFVPINAVRAIVLYMAAGVVRVFGPEMKEGDGREGSV